MSVIFAMSGDQNQVVTGRLFWDDGNSVDTVENQQYMLVNFNANDVSYYVKLLLSNRVFMRQNGFYPI